MNDMVRLGDWVTLPDKNIDGIVQEITLITVKIKNFDQSISTVPPTLLLTNTFKNWRELNENGEKLVSRSIFIDKTTVKFCSPELIQKIKSEIPLMADYQQPANRTAPTNIQLFRTYMENISIACRKLINRLILK
ncbi:MAG: mechanosensitive ion channel family protein [Tannerellaceae bacterium]|nr:mechanosensitive ion channel family protein [Tannerellaceae bacterium]